MKGYGAEPQGLFEFLMRSLLGALLVIFLAACTKADQPGSKLGAAAGSPDFSHSAKWLKEFTQTDAKGFQPVRFQSAVQCTVASLKGAWTKPATPETLGEAQSVWSFHENGSIDCAGPSCRFPQGLPKRFAMREVFLNTPQQNVGIIIISHNNLVTRKTCEVDGERLYLTNGHDEHMLFVRHSGA